MLSDFITKLIGSDITIFDDLEREIVELEQALIHNTREGLCKKKLFLYEKINDIKRYHRQILYVLECLYENENHIF